MCGTLLKTEPKTLVQPQAASRLQTTEVTLNTTANCTPPPQPIQRHNTRNKTNSSRTIILNGEFF